MNKRAAGLHRHKYNRPPGAWPRRCVKCGRREDDIKRDQRLRYRGIVTVRSVADHVCKKIASTRVRGLQHWGAVVKHAGAPTPVAHLDLDAPCYGSVPNIHFEFGKDTEILAFVDRSVNSVRRDHKDWASWWIKDSPFANAIITKNVDQVGKFVEYDVEKPASYVISAGIGLRYMHEKPTGIELWELFRRYTSPELAFVLSEGVHPIMNGKTLQSFQPADHIPGVHGIMNKYYYNAEVINNLINHRPSLKDCKPFRHKSEYSPLMAIWGPGGPERAFRVDIDWPKAPAQEVTDSLGRKRTIRGFLADDPAQVEWFVREFTRLNDIRKESE